MPTDLQRFVDEVLDAAQAAYPGVEFDITLSAANTLVLPLDSDELWRESNGVPGYYKGHVYRDCLVTGIASSEPAPIDYLVLVSPVHGAEGSASAVGLYGDLRTRTISTNLPPDIPTDSPQ